MRLRGNSFFCPWCEYKFDKNLIRTEGGGKKGRGVEPCICPKCGRTLSQKSQLEVDKKLSRGERV